MKLMNVFNAEVKPQNEALRKSLGIKSIEVTHEQYTHLVPVYVKVGKKQMKSSELAFYKALGLCL